MIFLREVPVSSSRAFDPGWCAHVRNAILSPDCNVDFVSLSTLASHCVCLSHRTDLHCVCLNHRTDFQGLGRNRWIFIHVHQKYSALSTMEWCPCLITSLMVSFPYLLIIFWDQCLLLQAPALWVHHSIHGLTSPRHVTEEWKCHLNFSGDSLSFMPTLKCRELVSAPNFWSIFVLCYKKKDPGHKIKHTLIKAGCPRTAHRCYSTMVSFTTVSNLEHGELVCHF